MKQGLFRWLLCLYQWFLLFIWLLYPHFIEVERGLTGFTSSVCLSVRPSDRPSVCPFVCGQIRVHFVTSTIRGESISYNTSDQAALEGVLLVKVVANFKNENFWNFFSNLELWLCFVLTWDLIWINSVGDHWGGVVFSECRRFRFS